MAQFAFDLCKQPTEASCGDHLHGSSDKAANETGSFKLSDLFETDAFSTTSALPSIRDGWSRTVVTETYVVRDGGNISVSGERDVMGPVWEPDLPNKQTKTTTF